MSVIVFHHIQGSDVKPTYTQFTDLLYLWTGLTSTQISRNF